MALPTALMDKIHHRASKPERRELVKGSEQPLESPRQDLCRYFVRGGRFVVEVCQTCTK